MANKIDFTYSRPHTTAVLAMSVDGKIADFKGSPARFGSATDKAHLEKQIAFSDGVLFGAGTLRTYGTTLRVSQIHLLEWRERQQKPSQPIQLVCSRSGNFDPELRFFQQPIPRWLLTTASGAAFWQNRPEFEKILVFETQNREIDLPAVFWHLKTLGLTNLAILGGGNLVASLIAADLIDELWLTVCPLILGGSSAPTPVEGAGFLEKLAPHLQLLTVEKVEQEVFLHYRLQR